MQQELYFRPIGYSTEGELYRDVETILPLYHLPTMIDKGIPLLHIDIFSMYT